MQRRATKLVPGLKDISYEERLRKLDLPTLAYCRLRGDVIEMYKILAGKYDPVVSNFIQFNTQLTTRGHQLKIFSFVNRTTNIWNSLPEKVVSAPSILSFERRLVKFWANHPPEIRLHSDRIPVPTWRDPRTI